MALGIYEEEDIRAIANKLRAYGDPVQYTVKQMADGIETVQVYSYNAGHSEGIAEGIKEGKSIGYAEGKTDGVEEGKNEAYSEIQDLNAELEQTLYGTDTGGKSFYDEFWDSVLNENTMRNFQNLFAGWGWNDTTFYPNKDIIVSGGRGDGMFARSNITNIKQRLIDCGVKLDLSKCTNLYQTFLYSTTSELPEISALNSTTFQQTFSDCAKLVTIDKLILKSDGSQTWASAFHNTQTIENIVIEGVIGQNGFNIQQCTKLTHDSLMSIINALKDNSGTDTWNTITLGAENIAKLTPEELEIMDLKQWNYS